MDTVPPAAMRTQGMHKSGIAIAARLHQPRQHHHRWLHQNRMHQSTAQKRIGSSTLQSTPSMQMHRFGRLNQSIEQDDRMAEPETEYTKDDVKPS